MTALDEGTTTALRDTYLLAFDSFSTDPIEVADRLGIKSRYARELLGVLVSHRLLAISDVNGEYDVWQVIEPGTYDSHTRDDAVAHIDNWLATFTQEDNMPATATKTRKPATKKATATKPKDTNPADLPLCKCGCETPVGSRKTSYRPGHDARHAGQVGRKFIEQGKADPKLLATLPSEKLQAKALRMLQVSDDKQDAKAAAAEAKAKATK